jgi:hypothetical protein
VGGAAGGEPAGVVVEAADLRVKVSGFEFGGRPCLTDLEWEGGGQPKDRRWRRLDRRRMRGANAPPAGRGWTAGGSTTGGGGDEASRVRKGGGQPPAGEEVGGGGRGGGSLEKKHGDGP